jgi:signal transduction histidine kinase
MRTESGRIYLEVLPPFLDDLQLFWPDSQEGFHRYDSGDLLAFTNRTVPNRTTVFVLPAPLETTTAYLRIKTSSSLIALVEAWEPRAFHAAASVEYWWFGIYGGFLLALILMNIMNGTWLREAGFRAYLCYLLAALLIFLGTHGWFNQLVFADYPAISNFLTPFFTLLFILAMAFYYRHAFRLSWQQTPVLFILVIGVVAGTLTGFAALLADAYVAYMHYFILYTTLINLVFILYSLHLLVRKKLESFWLLLATLFGLSGVVITSFSILGWVPGNLWFLYSYQAGAIMSFQMLMNLRLKRMQQDYQSTVIERETTRLKFEEQEKVKEMQGRFLAMLTHELKTPLSVIRMTLNLHKPSDEAKHFANLAVEDIDAIVNRCAYSEKLDFQAMQKNCTDVALLPFLQAIIEATGQAGRIQFNVLIEQNQVLRTDEEWLKVILSNLLDNALKYSPRDSKVELTIERLSGRDDKQQLCIHFSNTTGEHGLPDVNKIFTKYYREPSAMGQSGSGLGLYIVKGLADLLGATLRLHVHHQTVRFSVCLSNLHPK